jgi:hypothetical protein
VHNTVTTLQRKLRLLFPGHYSFLFVSLFSSVSIRGACDAYRLAPQESKWYIMLGTAALLLGRENGLGRHKDKIKNLR